MKIQIKSIFGSILFEYEKDKNSVLETLKQAIASRAELSRANLSGANLSGAELSGAKLYGAELYGANLSHANLSGAELSRANLSGAELSGADLYGAKLYGAELSRANLSGANLSGAELSGAKLYGAELYGANLSHANLSGAELSHAINLNEAKNSELVIARTRILPEGDLIGYKKCQNGLIVKLLIPIDAKRSHAFGRKCRAEYAKVLSITNLNGDEAKTPFAVSSHDYKFEYRVGETVKPNNHFSEDWTQECEGGIHFFITRIEAVNY